MPLKYDIDREHGIVFSRWIGRVTFSEIVEHAHHLHTDPRFDAHFSELMDMSGFSGTNATFVTLSGFVRHADPFALTSRRAVVAPGRAAFGIARMYQNLRGEEAVFEFFANIKDALHWLGLNPEVVPPLLV